MEPRGPANYDMDLEGNFDLKGRLHVEVHNGNAGLYFGFHLIEGETLTPMLLAKRFTLNPVLVVISLVFWFWMWGIPGGILSMPMLAITKIICDRVQPLAAFGHFLEG